jgi:hypothetical protein
LLNIYSTGQWGQANNMLPDQKSKQSCGVNLSLNKLVCLQTFPETNTYDNEYASIIDIYFYEHFDWSQTLSAHAPNILDTVSDILDKCLPFSLIKMESVSIFQAKPHLVPSFWSVVYTFLLK